MERNEIIAIAGIAGVLFCILLRLYLDRRSHEKVQALDQPTDVFLDRPKDAFDVMVLERFSNKVRRTLAIANPDGTVRIRISNVTDDWTLGKSDGSFPEDEKLFKHWFRP